MGQQWKKIISGALTGLAASSHSSPIRNFVAGYQAVQKQNIKKQRAMAQQKKGEKHG